MNAVFSGFVERAGGKVSDGEARGDRPQRGGVSKVRKRRAGRAWQAGHHRADEGVASASWVKDFSGQ